MIEKACCKKRAFLLVGGLERLEGWKVGDVEMIIQCIDFYLLNFFGDHHPFMLFNSFCILNISSRKRAASIKSRSRADCSICFFTLAMAFSN